MSSDSSAKKIKIIWTSPAGIAYRNNDKIFGNRIEHILSHGSHNNEKIKHSVFNVPRNKILELVDEAWIIKGNPELDDPESYVVKMGRVIGTHGENAIKIIVDKKGSNNIVTAYPIHLKT